MNIFDTSNATWTAVNTVAGNTWVTGGSGLHALYLRSSEHCKSIQANLVTHDGLQYLLMLAVEGRKHTPSLRILNFATGTWLPDMNLGCLQAFNTQGTVCNDLSQARLHITQSDSGSNVFLTVRVQNTLDCYHLDVIQQCIVNKASMPLPRVTNQPRQTPKPQPSLSVVKSFDEQSLLLSVTDFDKQVTNLYQLDHLKMAWIELASPFKFPFRLDHGRAPWNQQKAFAKGISMTQLVPCTFNGKQSLVFAIQLRENQMLFACQNSDGQWAHQSVAFTNDCQARVIPIEVAPNHHELMLLSRPCYGMKHLVMFSCYLPSISKEATDHIAERTKILSSLLDQSKQSVLNIGEVAPQWTLTQKSLQELEVVQAEMTLK